LALPAEADAGFQFAPGAADVVAARYSIGLLLFPAVPVNISLAVVVPAESFAGNVWLLSQASILGADDKALENVSLKTFCALLFPAPVALFGIAMLVILCF
jgi:hypothetical protein